MLVILISILDILKLILNAIYVNFKKIYEKNSFRLVSE